MFYNHLESADLFPVESTAAVKPDRIKPEFSYLILSFDMDMRRFISVAGIEEKPIRPDPESCWHYLNPTVREKSKAE